jgi:hypothetical protein
LLQHGIDQRGLAVIDVRDNCNIANARCQKGSSQKAISTLLDADAVVMPEARQSHVKPAFLALREKNECDRV